MEWLPLVVIGILIIILGLYFIVKWAVKDALKEYFSDKKIDPNYGSYKDMPDSVCMRKEL